MNSWKEWIREIAYDRIDRIERQLNASPERFPEYTAAARRIDTALEETDKHPDAKLTERDDYVHDVHHTPELRSVIHYRLAAVLSVTGWEAFVAVKAAFVSIGDSPHAATGTFDPRAWVCSTVACR